jgi:hypothetical protein
MGWASRGKPLKNAEVLVEQRVVAELVVELQQLDGVGRCHR